MKLHIHQYGEKYSGTVKQYFPCSNSNESSKNVTEVNKRGRYIIEAIMRLGIKPEVAIGCAAGIYGESYDWIPDVLNKCDVNGPSYGICQWHDNCGTCNNTTNCKGRYTNLKNYCSEHNLNYKTLEGQTEFLKYELCNDKKNVREELKGKTTTDEGLEIWVEKFEKPGSPKDEIAKRKKFIPIAQRAYDSKK